MAQFAGRVGILPGERRILRRGLLPRAKARSGGTPALREIASPPPTVLPNQLQAVQDGINPPKDASVGRSPASFSARTVSFSAGTVPGAFSYSTANESTQSTRLPLFRLGIAATRSRPARCYCRA